MKPERWQQLDELFHAALERSPEERAAFLDEACAGDETLRKQVDPLLCAHGEAGSFIESPAMQVAALGIVADHGTAGTQEAEMLTGKLVSHYRIISPLGSGGMGDVYLAQDTVLRRQVALKLLPKHFTSHRDRLRRFQQEARTASALNHPNIITIYEIGQVEDRHFIAAEFIDGATLRQDFFGGRQPSGQPLRLRELLDIAIQTADALAAAHEAGIVHRDLKPENIMVRRRDSYVKVLDFGLAKLTESAIDTEAPTLAKVKTSAGVVMGTVSYMSPEQARGEEVDARTDIWSLGVVLYEMVAGCAPFERASQNEVLASILDNKEAPPLARYSREVPAELERIVSKAVTKDREARYQTAKDLLIDLRRLKQRLEIEAEIERTSQTEKSDERLVATSNEQADAATTRAAASETGDAAVGRSTDDSDYLVKGSRLLKRGTLIALVAFVAVTATAAYFAYSRYAGAKRAGLIRSLAVMPFSNETGNPDTEYLCDGISESLMNKLSQLPGVKVIARSSSFKYKGKEIDPQTVASALGVDAILTGRVLQRGDNLVIRVELVNAGDEMQVWGEQYNRKPTDVLLMQSEISREIADKLRLHLTIGEKQQLTKGDSVNPQAYDLLTRGRFFKRTEGIENQNKAVEYFKQAITVDSSYALAYAELAIRYQVLYAGSWLEPKVFAPKAAAAVQKALELDDGLADAHYARALLRSDAWDWAAAEQDYLRAIELNPNLAEAHSFYAFHLMNMGRYDEAISETRRARELDPLSIVTNVQIGNALAAARRYDEAIESLKRTIEMDKSFGGAHFYLGYIYTAKGMYTEAISEYQESIKLIGDRPSGQIYLGAAYAKAGHREKAQAILKRLQTSKEYVSPAELVVLYAALGEREQAFATLEKAYAAHDLQLQFVGVDSSFDSLREDSRFKEFMRRIGLAP